MVSGVKVREVFSKLLVEWEMCAMDSVGLSRGHLSAWNPSSLKAFPFLSSVGILLEGLSWNWNRSLSLINYYGPYTECIDFWKEVEVDGILKSSNVILGGDLNLTLLVREVWGAHICLNTLASFFNNFFGYEGLVDVALAPLLLTWSNGRSGDDGVAK